MLGDFSDKAIAAKVRAMYRFRLTSADYEELMKKPTVGDAAAYLRDNTHYREALGQADLSAIHRGELEKLLRDLRYDQYKRLLAYNYSGKEIFRYLYFREEIRQLLALVQSLGSGEEDRLFGQEGGEDLRLDRRLAGETTLDLEKLGSAKSYPELLELLGDSPYKELLERFPIDESGQLDLLGCEREFYIYYYRRLLDLAEKELDGSARKAMKETIYGWIDCENIVQTYRLRRFFGGKEELIQENLLPFETPSRKLIDRMMAAEDVVQLHELLEETGIARVGEEREGGFIENLFLRLRARQSQKELHNSIHPPVVLCAYMTYLEIELEDIINIVESVRYGLPIEKMRKLLSITL